MRSISKPLNAFLSQSSFIKSHLHRSIHNNDEIFLVLFNSYFSTVTTHPSKSPHLKLPNFFQLPVVDPSVYLGHHLIGSVNGLLCFIYDIDVNYIPLQIWNPSISALLEIQDAGELGEYASNYRFGFDPNTDDYKIVRFSYFDEPEEFVLVHVFSMRKRSWELIKERFPSHFMDFGKDEVCGDGHDGRLHWLCYADKARKLQTIVAFDLGVEAFSEIRLSLPVLRNLDSRKNVLGTLAGKVCLMSCVKDGVCEVWVMNEYGDVTSWAKHHLLSQFSGDITPLGFTLNNEFLFAFNNVLSMYDPVTSKVNSFMTLVNHNFMIFQYVDSLVWINPIER